jgi:DNA-binding response OmpR family regulator
MQRTSPTSSQDFTIDVDILIVDDSPTDLQLLMEMMRKRHFEISIALDGETGYSQAVLLMPRLILVDVCMPGISGYALAYRLKAHPGTREIPLIFLTASNEVDERLKGFSAGACDYIGKPFHAQEVLARIDVHLCRRSPLSSPGGDATMDASGDEILVEAAKAILRRSLRKPPSLTELVSELSTNRRRLCDAFQSLSGQSVYGWIREERMRMAWELVAGNDLPLNTIADHLGFSSHANFTRAFRDRYRCIPSELRAELRDNRSGTGPEN